MRVCLLATLFVVACGCSRNPPKNHAVRAYPSAEAMAKWTDFSGEYTLRRITQGRTRANHRSFIDECCVSSNAQVSIRQSGPSNLVVVCETIYESQLATNAISIGKGDTPWTWVWNKGKAVYVSSYHGQGTMQPGTVSSRRTCVVSRNGDGSLTVESTRKSGGRWFWVMTWKDPVDQSVIRLVPAETPITPP
jgi:hypothetical protein